MEILDLVDKKNIFTVSELTKSIKYLLVEKFPDIWVRGEISNYRMASSGHIYFTLKDEFAVLKAVLFKGYQNGVRFQLEDGLKVITHGSIDLFEKRGEYQIIVDFIEPEGIGALELAFEQLKQKLQAEGLFDPSHKKPIPPFPDAIGVVTSQTGAAIRDILNIIGRRYRGIRVIIYPALVQGEGAAFDIAQSIRKANDRKEVDVLIVGRGGGSREDLWPFNEEILVRAIYESEIPIISAVGHEIDYTISDFVADLRAPTPSVAAELVVKNRSEILKWCKDTIARLYISLDRILIRMRDKLDHYTPDIFKKLITTIIHDKTMILDDLAKTLTNGTEGILYSSKARFEKTVGQLNALSPLSTLSRGFALVTKVPENRPVFSVQDINEGDEIRTRLKDGSLLSTVKDIQHGF